MDSVVSVVSFLAWMAAGMPDICQIGQGYDATSSCVTFTCSRVPSPRSGSTSGERRPPGGTRPLWGCRKTPRTGDGGRAAPTGRPPGCRARHGLWPVRLPVGVRLAGRRDPGDRERASFQPTMARDSRDGTCPGLSDEGVTGHLTIPTIAGSASAATARVAQGRRCCCRRKPVFVGEFRSGGRWVRWPPSASSPAVARPPDKV